MKTKFFTLLFISALLAACNNKQQNSTETTIDSLALKKDTTSLNIDTDIEASFADIKHFATYSEDFQLLVASLDGIFRGINLEMTKDQVKKLEQDLDAPLLKETADMLNYKVILGEGETAEITYNFKNNKTNTIDVKVKVESIEAFEALNAELIDYYSKKFGKMQFEDKHERWNISETHKLLVKDVMNHDKDFFILIEVK
jgi:hypothetical protein